MQICVAHHVHIGRAWALFALGELELGLGRPVDAVSGFTELTALLDRIGVRDVDLSPAPELAEALLRVGREHEAREVALHYRDRAVAKGQPWAVARAERALGLCEPDRVRSTSVSRPRSSYIGRPRTPTSTRARCWRTAHGCDGPGDASAPRPALREALASFERLGAMPWADQAAVELRATGETARRREPSTVDDLTPQELQIALVLADGRTTREAAASLFLSPKTVEYHLRHVYTKLGIGSRGELARVVGRDAGSRPARP